jgi:hypothetical protein
MKSDNLNRWLDLLTALLRHHFPVTFELAERVAERAQMRHVLRYSADVTVLEPADVREAVVRRLEGITGA